MSRPRKPPRGAELAAVAGSIVEPPKPPKRAPEIIADIELDLPDPNDAPDLDDELDLNPVSEPRRSRDVDDEPKRRRRSWAERLEALDERIAALQAERERVAFFALADEAASDEQPANVRSLARALRTLARQGLFDAARETAVTLRALVGGPKR